jgi:hypothetical protein
MFQYLYRLKADKTQGGLWTVQVYRSTDAVIPIATWTRQEDLYLTEVPELLVFEEERTKVKGCGPCWHYAAYARRVPGNWRFWSLDHTGTDALLRPAMARATSTAMRTTGGELLKVSA